MKMHTYSWALCFPFALVGIKRCGKKIFFVELGLAYTPL